MNTKNRLQHRHNYIMCGALLLFMFMILPIRAFASESNTGFFEPYAEYVEMEDLKDDDFLVEPIMPLEEDLTEAQAADLYQQVFQNQWNCYGTDYYYDKLPTLEHKRWWIEMNQVCCGYMDNGETVEKSTVFIPVPELASLPTMDLVNAFRYSNPQFYYLRSAYRYTRDGEQLYIAISFYDAFLDGAARTKATQIFVNGVDTWKKEITSKKDQLQVETPNVGNALRAIHDTICEKVEYNAGATGVRYDARKDPEFSQSIYSVLTSGKTLCAGYSMACTLFNNDFDIPTISMLGTGNGRSHAWNQVAMNDLWYNIDLTWDDEGETPVYTYYCRSDENFTGHVPGDSFLSYKLPCGNEAGSSITMPGNQFIPVTAHAWTQHTRIAPTPETYGMEAYQYCSACYRKEKSADDKTKVYSMDLILDKGEDKPAPDEEQKPDDDTGDTPDDSTDILPDVDEDPDVKLIPANHFGWWINPEGKVYWCEDGIKQGTDKDIKCVSGFGSVRGREIFDPETGSWYWLDTHLGGLRACNKEVWIPYIYQDDYTYTETQMNAVAKNSQLWQQVLEALLNDTGKWVRYDAMGQMIKGWYTVNNEEKAFYPDQVGNTYYYDKITGMMVKGLVVIDGKNYFFDEITGVMIE